MYKECGELEHFPKFVLKKPRFILARRRNLLCKYETVEPENKFGVVPFWFAATVGQRGAGVGTQSAAACRAVPRRAAPVLGDVTILFTHNSPLYV